jgi:hypothetical protein
MWADVIFRFLSSDYAILLSVLLTAALILRSQPSLMSMIWNDRVPWARWASRAAIGGVLLFLLWTTVLDNWRQMLSYLMAARHRWRSDPYLNDPPSDAVRFITFVLLGVAVFGMAYLYARYARGYIMPIILAPTGFLVFFVLNAFRVRFEVGGPLNDRAVDFTDPGEAVMSLIWFAMFYVVLVTLIVSAFAMVWGPVTVFFSLIYRRTIGREVVEEPEMFRLMRSRRANSG